MSKQERKPTFRIWVNTELRIVSFHPEKGFDLLEFYDQELFFSCIDEYTRREFRYQ